MDKTTSTTVFVVSACKMYCEWRERERGGQEMRESGARDRERGEGYI
jgi:hypothetical protein